MCVIEVLSCIITFKFDTVAFLMFKIRLQLYDCKMCIHDVEPKGSTNEHINT